MQIRYEFIFPDNRKALFDLTFEDATMSIVDAPVSERVEWIELTCNQCRGCPLDPSANRYCPVARNLAPVLVHFRDDKSYDPVLVKVITGDRTIEKNGRLETGVSSIMGLIMATSGCPVLDCFRPMAFMHLPFANENETLIRAVSTYLMGQYIRMSKGITPDWDLSNLRKMYTRISTLNQSFSERIRLLQGKDANVNAVISLDLFAQFGSFSLPDDWIEAVGRYFRAYTTAPIISKQ